MKKNKVIITSALPYVNAKPHIGFAFEIVLADIYARFYRQAGKEVRFVSGTDENSFKIFRAAKKAGLTAFEMAKKNSFYFINLKEKLNLSTDIFIRTSSDNHKRSASKFWKDLSSKDLYEKLWTAKYCPECESFMFTKEDQFCLHHKIKLEDIVEENIFFKIGNYKDRIKKDISKKNIIILPNSVSKKFVKEFGNYNDINISRKKETDWGIVTPGNKDRVMYSFFDALIGYITGLQFEQDPSVFKEWWNNNTKIIQFIGRDILKFHALYWPAMLYSEGINKIPNYIVVHGFITKEGEKISKSKGNVIDIDEVVSSFGVQPFRYFCARNNIFNDIDYSIEKIKSAQEELKRISEVLTRIIFKLEKSADQYSFTNKEKMKFKKYSSLMEKFDPESAMKIMWKIFIDLEKYISKKDNKKLDDEYLGRSVSLINKMLEPILAQNIIKK